MWSRVRWYLTGLIAVWCIATLCISPYISWPSFLRDSFEPAIQEDNVPLLADHDAAFESCSHDSSCVNPSRYGDARFAYGTSRGYFPAGCQWREVLGLNWTDNLYEYWDSSRQRWVMEKPDACYLQVAYSHSARPGHTLT
jgi:hypothetical protein